MKKVVIIGGGVSSLVLAKDLISSQHAEVILIEPKEYFEVPYAQLRALVEPETFSLRIRAPYENLLKGVSHIQKKAIQVTEENVILEDDSMISYDFLVIATGSIFTNWTYLKSDEPEIESRQKQVEKEHERLQQSQSILIIGGGAVGVELAGEIAYKWPQKKITLVTGSDRVLKELDIKSSYHAQKVLTQLNVELIFNTRLVQKSDTSWENDEGKLFSADSIYPVIGATVNSNWLSSSRIEVNDRGQVCVDESLKVKGTESIFAIGDINDVPEQKLGAFASKQAQLTAKNILTLIENQEAPLKRYKPNSSMGFVPIGKKKGVVQISSVHPHFLIALKQRDLFVSNYIKHR